jgi:hypothetical protein
LTGIAARHPLAVFRDDAGVQMSAWLHQLIGADFANRDVLDSRWRSVFFKL